MRHLLAAIAPITLIAIGSPVPAHAFVPPPPILLPDWSDTAAPAESEFTPLDEIDRARAAACGVDDFDEFLEWYANSSTSGGWLEQVVWTDYMVHVGKLADPDGQGHWVDRQDYLGQFRITSRDLRFSRDGIVAPRDTPNRHVTLTRLGEKQYRVDWRGGLGWAGVEDADRDAQAGAYIFEYKKNCWYLTGDLR